MMKKLQDIVGNEHAKRAIEVALSGGHDIVFIVMPDSPVELIEATKRLAFENDIEINCVGIKPCPCGGFGDLRSECNCSFRDIKKYISNIDICSPLIHSPIIVTINRPLPMETTKYNESEENIVARIQKTINSEIEVSNDIPQDVTDLLDQAVKHLGFHRGSIIEVAQTIAKMEGTVIVLPQHIVEAIQYRNNSFARSLLDYSPI